MAKILKYQKIYASLQQMIADTPCGAMLQSERELAELYDCNVLTVRKALKPLVEQGLIIRKTGSGTYRSDIMPGAATRDLKRFGLLLHRNNDVYANCVVQAIHQTAAAKDIFLSLGWTGDFGEDARRECARFAAEGCSTVIIPWMPTSQTAEVKKLVHAISLPVVLTSLIRDLEYCCFEHPECFGTDIYMRISGIYDYFENLGHRNIAYLGPNHLEAPVLQQSVCAYTSVISTRRRDNLCCLAGSTAEDMNDLARRWSRFKGELAVISYDDNHALRFMSAMNKLNLSSPRDFAIVGCNNTAQCGQSDPPLSSVEHDYQYIGSNVIRCASARARGNIEQVSNTKRCSLIVRESCGGAGRVNAEVRAAFHKYGEIKEL